MREVLYYSGSTAHPYSVAEFNNSAELFAPSNDFFVSKSQKLVHSTDSQFSTWLRFSLVDFARLVGMPKALFSRTAHDKVWSCGYIILNKNYLVTYEDATVFLLH